MLGKIRPLTVARQEIKELMDARDTYDEHIAQSEEIKTFCRNVDQLVSRLKAITEADYPTREEIEELNDQIETVKTELWGLQNK